MIGAGGINSADESWTEVRAAIVAVLAEESRRLQQVDESLVFGASGARACAMAILDGLGRAALVECPSRVLDLDRLAGISRIPRMLLPLGVRGYGQS